MEAPTKDTKQTPMMEQWHALKETAKNAVLLFRMGDFYEAFYEDAEIISKELGLTLTKRQEVPMSGVPFHTCENYIDKLVARGYRVAVAEQTGDPKASKGLVKREIVRFVTPGTLMSSNLLSEASYNFFASLTQVGSLFGLAIIDLTTAHFLVSEFDSIGELLNEIHRLRPSEILTSKRFAIKNEELLSDIQKAYQPLVDIEEDWQFDPQFAYDTLASHFQIHSLDGFGMKSMTAAVAAAGALLHYLQDQLTLPIGHIRQIHPYSTQHFMSLDRATIKNLELDRSYAGGRRNTLLSLLDQTKTPMGARLIQHWMIKPLLAIETILDRQEAVEGFFQNPPVLETFRKLLGNVKDLERLMMKVSTNCASPKEIVLLRLSLEAVSNIKQLLSVHVCHVSLLQKLIANLSGLPELTRMIASAIVDDPPVRLSDGNIFKTGYHQELDELRKIKTDSQSWLVNYQLKLREKTKIKSLKISYNKAFGYFIEVSKGQAGNVPDHFERRQTLVNAERYTVKELKEYEYKVLNAEEKIIAIESDLFHTLREQISKFANHVLIVAQSLAYLDCLQSLADAARRYDYTRPVVDNEDRIQISEGRHPIIEAANTSHAFVANDTHLDDNNRLVLITGPNMAGKSTYIRQVALICIMAQMGAFVPAKFASIGLVDKVFTRIGASDDLSRGQSTFMVEMTETANILNNATSRSLVILDEIGRGTSTYDGISIAWSVAEFLLTSQRRAKTLFATHYFELTKLEEKVKGAQNYTIAVHESEDGIDFLRKIVRGGTDKSYGIHVARLAGLPLEVIERAKEILTHLEDNANRQKVFEPSKPKQRKRKSEPSNQLQLSLFDSH